MKDRSPTRSSAGGTEVAGAQVAGVGALVHLDAGVGPQALVELAVAHVDGHDGRGAPLEERSP